MKQDRALEIMLAGHNVMLTGPAGAGKSYLLNKFVQECRQKHRKVVVTATTGLAAAHLNGQTIHSWSGIGLDKELAWDYIYRMSDMRKKAIKKTSVLIIDEISMMHDYNLDMVDKAMQLIRENDAPFGGIQVILCGDFFQLPPVMQGGTGKFVTESKAWKSLNFTICYLEEQHRAEDLRLQQILNAMRAGTMTQEHVTWLQSRMSERPKDDITKIYTTNADVEAINEYKLKQLPGDTHYLLRTSRGKSWEAILQLQRSVLAPGILALKVGALVMGVKNDSAGRYVNGSIGEVLEFTEEGFPVVLFTNGHQVIVEPQEWVVKQDDVVKAAITQIPLRLAYAITVHKSQGMTLDQAQIDLSKAFVEGMGYVALSRVKSLGTMFLKGLNQTALMVSKEARRIDKELREKSRGIK